MINVPAISVIIPMYNAEKYIGACLESILAQTFQDFEVIVVDDCSTDSSVAVVESYAPKFNGLLKLSSTGKNSGLPPVPRNKGLKLSRGEYVFFVDNDDLLTLTALEELCTLAKNFDADVVYCEKYYEATINLDETCLTTEQAQPVTNPIFETDNFEERLNHILQRSFFAMPWLKLVKRDLLIEHEIIFPNIIRDDDIWTWNLVFHAKKFLRVPNAVYVWRKVETSVTRIEKTHEQQINFWLNPVIMGLKTLDEIMNRVEFFKQNLQWRHEILFYFVKVSLMVIRKYTSGEPPFAVYENIREKFSNILGKQDALIPVLFSFVNIHQDFIDANRRRIAELETLLKEKSQ